MATTPDGIPIVSSKSFQSGSIPNNPVQQLVNAVPQSPNMHDCGYSVEENIFNKSRLDSSLEEQKARRQGNAASPNSIFNNSKADY